MALFSLSSQPRLVFWLRKCCVDRLRPPEQWVGWGDRTVDEMAHAWVDVTYLEQEDFDKEVAEAATSEE